MHIGRAIHNRDAITRYVESSSDLSDFALLDLDWEALQAVRSWLSEFRQATTEMSTTSKPMLSQTHLVFRSLQRTIKDILSELPNTADAMLKQGLVHAHTKLGDYYYKFDASPYYLWAARKLVFPLQVNFTNLFCSPQSSRHLRRAGKELRGLLHASRGAQTR